MAKIKVTNPKYVIDAHLKTNYFKLRNTGGPKGDKGDKGDTGATGPEGPQGATGATGRAATVAIGTTQTLNPGQSAFVNNVGTNNDAIFNFGIPQGEKGDKGDTGATGATGQAATVTVGTTTTLAAGSDATVNNSGTSSAAVLNFGIPKGAKGDTGEKGDTGGVRSEYVTELPASGQENTYYLTGDTATIGTASGESFQVTNNDNTGQVLLTQLNGNATQDGTPTPDAPIAIETVTGGQTVSVVGKNYFDANRTLGTPSDTTASNTTKRTYDYSKYVLGLSANNYYYPAMVSSCSVANGAITVTVGTTAYGVGFPVDVRPNTTYTLSCTKTTTATGDVRIMYYQADGTYIWFEGSNDTPVPLTFTTPANCEHIVVLFRPDAGVVTTYSNIQLEIGSSASAYTPFQGWQSYEINLGSIELAKIGTYQDYIWNDDGVWKIHKEVGKVVLDGSEYYATIASQNTGNTFYAETGAIDTTAGSSPVLLSNYFTQIFNLWGGDNEGAQIFYLQGTHKLRFRILKTALASADVAGWRTWLSTHNTTVYYALATPTDTEITDDTLLAQLNTISELYGGVNNISLVPSAGAQGTITIKYTTWDKNNRYDVYIWNDTIGDFQIIHSGGGNN